MRSGWVRAATSPTHFSSLALRVGAALETGAACACMCNSSSDGPALVSGGPFERRLSPKSRLPSVGPGLLHDLRHFDLVQQHGFSDLQRPAVEAGERLDPLGERDPHDVLGPHAPARKSGGRDQESGAPSQAGMPERAGFTPPLVQASCGGDDALAALGLVHGTVALRGRGFSCASSRSLAPTTPFSVTRAVTSCAGVTSNAGL